MESIISIEVVQCVASLATLCCKNDSGFVYVHILATKYNVSGKCSDQALLLKRGINYFQPNTGLYLDTLIIDFCCFCQFIDLYLKSHLFEKLHPHPNYLAMGLILSAPTAELLLKYRVSQA